MFWRGRHRQYFGGHGAAEIDQHLDLFRNDPILLLNEDGSTYALEISVGVIRAVIGVAAFAGLREGEIRGLWWEDDELSIPVSPKNGLGM